MVVKYTPISRHLITGRGLVFVIEPTSPIKLNDVIEVDNTLYLVRGIEGSHYQTTVGVVVMELKYDVVAILTHYSTTSPTCPRCHFMVLSRAQNFCMNCGVRIKHVEGDVYAKTKE